MIHRSPGDMPDEVSAHFPLGVVYSSCSFILVLQSVH